MYLLLLGKFLIIYSFKKVISIIRISLKNYSPRTISLLGTGSYAYYNNVIVKYYITSDILQVKLSVGGYGEWYNSNYSNGSWTKRPIITEVTGMVIYWL